MTCSTMSLLVKSQNMCASGPTCSPMTAPAQQNGHTLLVSARYGQDVTCIGYIIIVHKYIGARAGRGHAGHARGGQGEPAV